MAIIKSESYMPSLFFKEKVFQKLMSHQIARLQSPSLQCLELIKLEMERIIETLRFPSSNVYINLQIELNTVRLP